MCRLTGQAANLGGGNHWEALTQPSWISYQGMQTTLRILGAFWLNFLFLASEYFIVCERIFTWCLGIDFSFFFPLRVDLHLPTFFESRFLLFSKVEVPLWGHEFLRADSNQSDLFSEADLLPALLLYLLPVVKEWLSCSFESRFAHFLKLNFQ